MKYPVQIGAIVLVALSYSISLPGALAQVASHSTTAAASSAAPMGAAGSAAANMVAAPQVSDKAVARVNGAVLTDRDLLREMYTIFPYAQQHNGFPKAQEASIRQGALEMIIFEELVYQEAVRLKLTVPAEKINRAEAEFKKQFKSPDEYQAYMTAEMQGSEAKLRQQIRRSILIEQLLKTDVENRSAVTLAEVKAYYDKNAVKYTVPESYNFQSISIMPPYKPTPKQAEEAKKSAEDALKLAKATKSYEDFGMLAEKVSQDDFRVNMGDHKVTAKDKLPPQIVKAFAAMQPGQVSGLIQIESAYTIVRLNAHTAAKKKSLHEVQAELKVDLQKSKYEKLRSGLAKQLRAKAKVEVS
jgi:peptidyl-prolyl cis-trans isomerase SurA